MTVRVESYLSREFSHDETFCDYCERCIHCTLNSKGPLPPLDPGKQLQHYCRFRYHDKDPLGRYTSGQKMGLATWEGEGWYIRPISRTH